MRILLTPYDIATCSIAARGALSLGGEVSVAFPAIDTLSGLRSDASRLIDDAFGWTAPLLAEGLIQFDQDAQSLWQNTLDTARSFSEPEWFADACPALDPSLTDEDRSRRMLIDVLHGGRDGWSRLAADISAEHFATHRGLVLARERAASRSAKIEQALASVLCRFAITIPSVKDAQEIPRWIDAMGSAPEDLSDAVGSVIAMASEEVIPNQGTIDALRDVATILNERADQVSREEGWSNETAAVTAVRLPLNITLLAAKSAMCAVQNVPNLTADAESSARAGGAFALIIKPTRLRA